MRQGLEKVIVLGRWPFSLLGAVEMKESRELIKTIEEQFDRLEKGKN